MDKARLTSMQLESFPGERWRPIPGYERYEVSNIGRVRSYMNLPMRILKIHLTGKGSAMASVWDRERKHPVHKAVRGLLREVWGEETMNKVFPKGTAIQADRRRELIFNFICQYKREHDGCYPAYREIAAGIEPEVRKMLSTSMISAYLTALEKEGRIRLVGGRIEVVNGRWVFGKTRFDQVTELLVDVKQ